MKWGGILHRFVPRANGETSSALVVPVSMQYKLLRVAHVHHYAGHKGTTITLQHPRKILVAKYDGGRRPVCGKL